MLKSVALTLLMGSTLFGGLLDFRTLEKAKEAYANAQYGEAAALYESIDDKNDDLIYNLGDAYYKDKKYKEALKQFEQVKKAELRAKSLHNMGNAYANTKQVDKAIAAYEEALKLGEDEDTRFNLELLKKQKQEQQKQDQKDQKNQNKDDQDQQKQNQNGQDQQKKNDQQKNDQTSDEKSKQEQQEKQSDTKSEQDEKEKQAKEDKASKDNASEEETKAMKEGEAKEEPISDMQERKYEKMLDKRGIRTLMVPLKTEGAQDEETTAW